MTIPDISIGNRIVGDDSPALVIAEIGLAHDGSLGSAHAFIDAASAAGADAVKFQTHIANAESTPFEEFRVKVFPQDVTRFDYWERTSFSESQWRELKEHAENKKLIFMSTPFSIAAIKLLRRIGVKVWKIGSGDVNNLPLLEEISKGVEPVLLSSGMSYMHEIAESVNFLRKTLTPVMVMQCTSSYPCPPEKYGLNLIGEFRDEFRVHIGFSDHSGEIAPGLAAVAMGAKVVEVHVTWSKDCFGPDIKSSLTFKQLAELVKGVRLIGTAMKTYLIKDEVAQDMSEMRMLFTKGLYAVEPIVANTVLEKHHFETRKPLLGIPASKYLDVLGKVLTRDLSAGEPIAWKDLIGHEEKKI